MQEWPIRQKLVLDFTNCACVRGCRLVDCVAGIPNWYGNWNNEGYWTGICRLEGSNVVNDQIAKNRLGFGTFMEAVRPVFKGLANEAEVEMLRIHGFVGTYESVFFPSLLNSPRR